MGGRRCEEAEKVISLIVDLESTLRTRIYYNRGLSSKQATRASADMCKDQVPSRRTPKPPSSFKENAVPSMILIAAAFLERCWNAKVSRSCLDVKLTRCKCQRLKVMTGYETQVTIC